MSVPATAAEEQVGFFPAGGETLFGVVTRPTVDPLGMAFIVLPGGGRSLAMGRSRFQVRLCRDLAAMGFHAMRFDYHGGGESTGVVDRFRMGEPFSEDLAGAARWAESLGIDRSVLMGSCFGARTALSFAEGHEGVEAIVLVTPVVRDPTKGEGSTTMLATRWGIGRYLWKAFTPRVLAGLFDRRRRKVYGAVARAKIRGLRMKLGDEPEWRRIHIVSENFLRALRRVVDRRVPILILFGTEDDYRVDFEEARGGELGRLLERAGSLAEIVTLPGRIHGFTTLEAQESVAALIHEWCSRIASAARAS